MLTLRTAAAHARRLRLIGVALIVTALLEFAFVVIGFDPKLGAGLLLITSAVISAFSAAVGLVNVRIVRRKEDAAPRPPFRWLYVPPTIMTLAFNAVGLVKGLEFPGAANSAARGMQATSFVLWVTWLVVFIAWTREGEDPMHESNHGYTPVHATNFPKRTLLVAALGNLCVLGTFPMLWSTHRTAFFLVVAVALALDLLAVVQVWRRVTHRAAG